MLTDGLLAASCQRILSVLTMSIAGCICLQVLPRAGAERQLQSNCSHVGMCMFKVFAACLCCTVTLSSLLELKLG